MGMSRAFSTTIEGLIYFLFIYIIIKRINIQVYFIYFLPSLPITMPL
jgi:hypothetical protein